MSTRNAGPTAELLLEQSAWMGRMARTLVGESAAEDLVQETWAAALSHRPDPDRPLRPWLFTVLRNFARRAGRRAPAKDLGCAGGAAELPGPEELCEGLETGRVVAEELSELEEPFRSTLLLRFYQDIEPIEIARRQGTPAGTVRWRISRGLELLRTRLDRRFGGRRGNWCSALLPLARSGDAAALSLAGTSSALPGILGMKIGLKFGVASALLLVVAVGLGIESLRPGGLFSSGSKGQELAVAFRPIPPAPEASPDAGIAPPVSGAERSAVETSAPESDVPAGPELGPTHAFVEAEIVDEEGRALVGARLRELAFDGIGAEASTRSGGSVRLELFVADGARGTHVEARARGHASRVQKVRLEPGATVELGRVELLPGGQISGRVVDEDGQGVPRALVTSGDAAGHQVNLEIDRYQAVEPILRGDLSGPMTVADERGEFELTGLPAGYVRLWARAEGFLPTYTEPVEVRAGQDSHGAEVVLEAIRRAHRIEGIVLEPGGAPVPFAPLAFRHRSAELHYSTSSHKEARADGTFGFVVPPDAELAITAGDPLDRFVPVTVEGLRTGELELALVLVEGVPVRLSALGPDGAPLDRFKFEVLAADDEQRVLQSGGNIEGEAGETTLRVPDVEFLVRVTAPLCRTATAGPFEPGESREEIAVRMTAAPGLPGRVLSAEGPVAGAEVELRELVADRDRVERNGFRCWQEPLCVEETTTDGEGRFVLTPRAAGEYVVRVEADGFAPAEWGPITIAADLVTDSAEVHLGPGGAIEGRIVTSRGEDPTGVIVAVDRGDGHPQTQRVGRDGRYRFDSLMPGSWLVTSREEDVLLSYVATSPATRSFESEVQWTCEVHEGRTTFYDVRLDGGNDLRIEGRVELKGVLAGSLSVRLTRGDQVILDDRGDWLRAPLGPDGRFEVGVPEPGPWCVMVKCSSLVEEWAFVDIVHVVDAVTPWELDEPMGSVVLEGPGTVVDEDGDPALVYLWEGAGDLCFYAAVPPERDGVSVVAHVPAGPGELRIPDFENLPDSIDLATLDWELAARVRVTAGEEVRIPAP